ncbi:MAG: hypothetical protein CFE28_05235 [Alphaproteobacteria bacterium PA2]|nr:MAG: hypothetical protein CFE28_05235 [Alphaproteobacteria bacterium PA2]
MRKSFKASIASSAALAVLFLAGCASDPGTPLAVAPSPPPAVVRLAPAILEQASAYRTYMDRTSAITGGFQSGEDIAAALQSADAYEPTALVRGAMAYGAIAALQDQAFVAGIRSFGSGAEQRRQLAYEILRNPSYVLGLPGSISAQGLVVQALNADGQALYNAGKAVKQSAYDLQKQPWSKAEVADRPGRLARAKELSSALPPGESAVTARLQQASVGAVNLGLTPATAAGANTEVVVRSLAVAALAVLNQADTADMASIDAVMADRNVSFCMTMSKLNLYQCLAVSRPNYEDIFCLGQHVMMDTGRCVIKASGQAEPFEAKFIPVVRSDIGYNQPKKPVRKKTSKSR